MRAPLPPTASIGSDACSCAGESMMSLLRALYPICRSITGPGVRETMATIGNRIELKVTEVPTGTPVFDWTIPREWSIEDAYLQHESGARFAEFRQSNLHVVSYSVPVDEVLDLEQLRPRLHTLPAHPDWIPWRSSYYKDDWGFCMAHNEAQAMPAGRYRTVIRSRLTDGSLTLGEFVHQGSSDQEVLLFAHTCHPSLSNDNLSGIVVATALAEYLARYQTRYTYRLILAPATIGSIAWTALNEARLPLVRHGLVLAMLGDGGPLHYQRTKSGRAQIDRAAGHVLTTGFAGAQLLDFSPWGFDERQFNMPGIGLAVGRLTRTLTGHYPQEHTSADTPDQISVAALTEAWLATLRIVEVLEADSKWTNLLPKGEPQLGRRGLYRQAGGYYDSVPERHMAILWLLQLCDGNHSLLDIAERSGLEFGLILSCACELERAGLLARPPEAKWL